jgi:hypothetical protein
LRLANLLLTDSTPHESHRFESISPSLHLGATGAERSTWLGPAWAALCGLIASSAFSLDGPSLLAAVFVFVLADWAWPAVWTICVRTDWVAPIGRWRDSTVSSHSIRMPYLQPGSPGDRLLGWLSRLSGWRRTHFAPMTGASTTSLVATLVVDLALSATIGWRALALSLAAIALAGIGTLHALRTALDSDGLRAMVYGTLPWWLGHAAFAPLTVESAALGVLFGLVYRAMMGPGQGSPSIAALIAPQAAVAVALFGGNQPAAALVIALAIVAQAALRAFLTSHRFARRAQAWLMLAMLTSAIAIA